MKRHNFHHYSLKRTSGNGWLLITIFSCFLWRFPLARWNYFYSQLIKIRSCIYFLNFWIKWILKWVCFSKYFIIFIIIRCSFLKCSLLTCGNCRMCVCVYVMCIHYRKSDRIRYVRVLFKQSSSFIQRKLSLLSTSQKAEQIGGRKQLI